MYAMIMRVPSSIRHHAHHLLVISFEMVRPATSWPILVDETDALFQIDCLNKFYVPEYFEVVAEAAGAHAIHNAGQQLHALWP